jgi:nitrogen fixation NifU-like protein
MVQYSEKLLDHFQNPRNVGIIDNADGIGKLSSDVCGDLMHLYITIENGVITDARFTTFGCAAAVASGSMLTEMIIGMSLKDAEEITKEKVADNLGGVPEPKMHCSLLAADCLKLAIEDYRKKQEGN